MRNMKALTLTIHKVWSVLKFVAGTDKQTDSAKTICSWSIDAGHKKSEYESSVFITVDLKHCPMQYPSLK